MHSKVSAVVGHGMRVGSLGGNGKNCRGYDSKLSNSNICSHDVLWIFPFRIECEWIGRRHSFKSRAHRQFGVGFSWLGVFSNGLKPKTRLVPACVFHYLSAFCLFACPIPAVFLSCIFQNACIPTSHFSLHSLPRFCTIECPLLWLVHRRCGQYLVTFWLLPWLESRYLWVD